MCLTFQGMARRRVIDVEKIRQAVESGERKWDEPIQEAPVPVTRMAEKRMIGRTEEKVDDVQERVRALEIELVRQKRKSPAELRAALTGMFESINFSPAEELARMVMQKKMVTGPSGEQRLEFELEPALRAKILSDLNQYVMPKLKSVEHSGEVDLGNSGAMAPIIIMRFGDDGKVTEEKSVGPMKRDEFVLEGGVVPENKMTLEVRKAPVPRKVMREVDGVFREIEV